MSLCRNQKCSNVAKCSNYYILPCTCIGIYRQNVVIYYKTGYHFFDICSLNVVTWNYYNMYNKDQVWMGNKILNVVIFTIISFRTVKAYELGQAKRGLMVIFEILGRDISVIEYYKSFHWFFAYILENKCNGILLNSLRCMFDISYCDVICSHYVRKAISPLFAWPSSYVSLFKF